jgi:hypothetical protein
MPMPEIDEQIARQECRARNWEIVLENCVSDEGVSGKQFQMEKAILASLRQLDRLDRKINDRLQSLEEIANATEKPFSGPDCEQVLEDSERVSIQARIAELRELNGQREEGR